MKRLIRPTYPIEFSIAILIFIFCLSSFLSYQVFETHLRYPPQRNSAYLGMLLIGSAVIIMTLIIWEEILFPIKIEEEKGSIIFRNHHAKLKTQIILYCIMPAIFGFLYLQYQVHLFQFCVWLAICLGFPVIDKFVSGINNYNDYLRLSEDKIEYRNNEKIGSFKVNDIQKISIIKDEKWLTRKIIIDFNNAELVTIDLDEMELEPFYSAIYDFIIANYSQLYKEDVA